MLRKFPSSFLSTFLFFLSFSLFLLPFFIVFNFSSSIFPFLSHFHFFSVLFSVISSFVLVTFSFFLHIISMILWFCDSFFLSQNSLACKLLVPFTRFTFFPSRVLALGCWRCFKASVFLIPFLVRVCEPNSERQANWPRGTRARGKLTLVPSALPTPLPPHYHPTTTPTPTQPAAAQGDGAIEIVVSLQNPSIIPMLSPVTPADADSRHFGNLSLAMT